MRYETLKTYFYVFFSCRPSKARNILSYELRSFIISFAWLAAVAVPRRFSKQPLSQRNQGGLLWLIRDETPLPDVGPTRKVKSFQDSFIGRIV